MATSFALVEGNSANVDLFPFKLRRVAKRSLADRYGIGRYAFQVCSARRRLTQRVGQFFMPVGGSISHAF
jgi:hypothetical protein